MAKQIVIEHKDKEYTLEFNRKSVQAMERGGFVLDDIDRKPMTMVLTLFIGAFMAHHSGLKESKVIEIYESLGKKQKLLETLVEMYNETMSTLIDSDDEDDERKNESWTVRG